MKLVTLIALAVAAASSPGFAQVATQVPTEPTFEVVSIKRVNELRQSGGMRILPDGTVMMMNGPIGSLVNAASPVPITPRDILGGPDWLWRDNYDVTVKPPEGLTPEQRREMTPMMWRAMFADRMKLVAHIEQREKEAFALVPIGGIAGGDVDNRTGLTGSYSVKLNFSLQRIAGAPLDANAAVDAAPDIFTALQEQLGLKLQRGEKKAVPVFVIDRIERPSEN